MTRTSTIRINLLGDSFNYIAIFMLLYIPSSFVFTAISGTITLMACIILTAFIVLFNIKNVSVNYNIIFLLIIMTLNIVVTGIINGEIFKDVIITLIFFLVSFFTVISIPLHRFLQLYCKVILFLCLFSLVSYTIALILPQLIMKFPVVYNQNGLSAYSLFFSNIRYTGYFLRNYGLFWEPGAFQIFVNIGLIIKLFLLKEDNIKYIIISILTILTTFSTTGYIVGALILFLYASQKINIFKLNKNNIKIATFIVLLILSVSVIYINLPRDVKFQVFGKIFAEFENISGVQTSTSVRIDAIIYPLKAFLSNPFVGIGYEKLRELAIFEGYIMNTSTPINWFAIYGIVIGTLSIIGLYKFSNKINGGKILRFSIFFLLILVMASEDLARNPAILILLFYGYTRNKKLPKKEENIAL